MEHIIARVETLYKNNYNVNIIFGIIVTFQLENKCKQDATERTLRRRACGTD